MEGKDLLAVFARLWEASRVLRQGPRLGILRVFQARDSERYERARDI